MWGDNYEVVGTEWDLIHKEDHSFFEVNKMMVMTDHLLWIKKATHAKIYPHEQEAEVYRREETLVQSLKQFHAHFYWLCENVMTLPWLAAFGQCFQEP